MSLLARGGPSLMPQARGTPVATSRRQQTVCPVQRTNGGRDSGTLRSNGVVQQACGNWPGWGPRLATWAESRALQAVQGRGRNGRYALRLHAGAVGAFQTELLAGRAIAVAGSCLEGATRVYALGAGPKFEQAWLSRCWAEHRAPARPTCCCELVAPAGVAWWISGPGPITVAPADCAARLRRPAEHDTSKMPWRRSYGARGCRPNLA